VNNHNPVQPGRPPVQDVLIVWLQQHLRPTRRATDTSPTTYLVKHVAERSLGARVDHYVSESDLRKAARKLGYPLTEHTVGVFWRDLSKADHR
jgi:hypothetical protein